MIYILLLAFLCSISRASLLPQKFYVGHCYGELSQPEFSALEALYNSTNGEHWRWDPFLPATTQWSFPASLSVPCTNKWQGVNCSYVNTSNVDQSPPCFIYSLLLAERRLSGPLPGEIGNLENTVNIALCKNMLTGTVPSQLQQLSSVVYMFLYNNLFTGTLPSSLGLLTQIQILELYQNYLTGPIPLAITNLQKLEIIGLVYNQFSGTIPTEFGSIAPLEYLYLYNNLLTGTIPTELGLLSSLLFLGLNGNHLHGSIPSQLGNLKSVTIFQVFCNRLSGTIPTELGLITTLLNFDMHANHLTGCIPEQLGNLVKLQDVVLNDNSLSCSIPQSIIALPKVISVTVAGNLLTGTLPPLYTPNLNSLVVDYNYLDGTLSSRLNDALALVSFTFGSNFLYGSIPCTFASIRTLQLFNGSSNQLSGPLSNMFPINSTLSASLQYLELSANQLTGTIPAPIFTSSMLKGVALFSNCFSGSLPEEICNAPSLKTLILDAVTSAPCCVVQIPTSLKPIFKGVFPIQFLTGAIPSCVWSMAQLSTLHLSGNGLTGTLGVLPVVSTNLVDVNLQNNKLTGSIPDSFQIYGRFKQLVLAHNKLDGTLSSSFALNYTGTTVDLSVNRLSGTIPASLLVADNVNILTGNLFGCTQNSKPESDPDSSKYVCGSNDLDYSIFLTFGLIVGFALVFALVYAVMLKVYPSKLKVFQLMILEYNTFCSTVSAAKRELVMIYRFTHLMAFICAVSIALTAVYICFPLIMYLIFKFSYLRDSFSTHAVQYSWAASAAYLHGLAPVLVILLSLGLSVTILRVTLNQLKFPLQESSDVASPPLWPLTQRAVVRILLTISMQLVNIIVTLAVNIAYVYAVLQGLSPYSLSAIQFLLGVYKLVWINGIMSHLIRKLDFLTPPQQLIHRGFMSLFTFVAGPFLATFFSDPSCFKYVISSEGSVTSSFQENSYVCASNCVTFIGCLLTCGFSSTVEVTTVVSPGWLYSFQCSSALLANYVPVLMISFLLSGVIAPLIHITFLHLPIPVIHLFVPQCVRRVLFVDFIYMTKDEIIRRRMPDASRLSEINLVEKSDRRQLFNSTIIVTRLLLNLALLMTFGLASPLFAIIVSIDTISLTLLWRLLLGRYIHFSCNSQVELQNSQPSESTTDNMYSMRCLMNSRLEVAAVHASEGVGRALTMVMLFVGMFWSLFVFDMLGDVYGSQTGAISVFIPIVILLVLLWLLGLFQPSHEGEDEATMAEHTAEILEFEKAEIMHVSAPISVNHGVRKDRDWDRDREEGCSVTEMTVAVSPMVDPRQFSMNNEF